MENLKKRKLEDKKMNPIKGGVYTAYINLEKDPTNEGGLIITEIIGSGEK